MVYEEGHVKRNPANGSVAIRTMFSDTDPEYMNLAWLAATPRFGSKNMTTADVEGWDDLFVPADAEAPPADGG